MPRRPPTPIPQQAKDCLGKGRLMEQQMPFVIRQIQEKRVLEQEPPECDGNGVVIAGGGKYLSHAWVACSHLRNIGYPGPIQVWHLGRGEMPDNRRALFGELGVGLMDIHQMMQRYPIRRMDGWNTKIYAITHCGFRNALFCDADCLIDVNPQEIFLNPIVRDYGTLLSADVKRCHASSWGYSACQLRRLEKEAETGFFIVDRVRGWMGVRWSYWFAEHSEVWNRWGFGDKHYIELGFRIAKIPLFFNTDSRWEGFGIAHYLQNKRVARHCMASKRGEHPWPADAANLFAEWTELTR